MTFATEKEKLASERFMLCKVTPARYISESMASEGGGIYSIAWTYNIDRIERNGVELTEDSSAPTVNDHWYHDGSSLEVKLAAAPSSTNIIVVFYNLFYTTAQHRLATVDPENTSTDQVYWEARLASEPSVKQSVKNVINGVLTTSITSISILNPDDVFQEYLTDDDSFYEKKVKCWICINDVSNIQKIFEGNINKIKVGKDKITLTLYDIFSLLDQPCLMGDPSDEAYYLRSAGSFPTMFPDDDGSPVPFVIGSSSAYLTADDTQIIKVTAFSDDMLDFRDDTGSFTTASMSGEHTPQELATQVQNRMQSATSGGWNHQCDYSSSTRKFTITSDSTLLELLWSSGPTGTDIKSQLGFNNTDKTGNIGSVGYTSDNELPQDEFSDLKKGSMLRAVCTVYSPYRGNSFNRTWGLCRTNNSGMPTITTGTYVSATSNTLSWMIDPVTKTGDAFAYWEFSGATSWKIGDTFKCVDWLAVTSYHRVVNVESFDYKGTNYNLTTRVMQGTFATANPPTLSELDDLSVVVEASNGTKYFPIKGRDYSIFEDSLASGNKYYYIKFKSFESNVGITDFINPEDYQVFFRTGVDSNNLHSEALEQLTETAGLTVNSASFAAAGSALDANAQFSIPQIDETEFGSYRSYAELICKSTMGVIFANSDFELEYKLLEAPSSTTLIDDNIYLIDSLSADIQYQDIVTEISTYNPHNASEQAVDAVDSPNVTISSDKGRYLHGVRNAIRFRHVLETITDRAQAIFDILSNRLAVYYWKVSTDSLDRDIGDDLKLESPFILGGVGSKELKIISLDKSANEVSVQATDLLDI